MAYFIAPDGGYPRHIGDVQIDDSNFVYGESALPNGWVEVAEGVVPEYNVETETFYEDAPALINGVMTRQFVVRPLTAQEIKDRQVII